MTVQKTHLSAFISSSITLTAQIKQFMFTFMSKGLGTYSELFRISHLKREFFLNSRKQSNWNNSYLDSFIVNKWIHSFVSCLILSLVHKNAELRPPLRNSKSKYCINTNTAQWDTGKCCTTLYTLGTKIICKNMTNKTSSGNTVFTHTQFKNQLSCNVLHMSKSVDSTQPINA